MDLKLIVKKFVLLQLFSYAYQGLHLFDQKYSNKRQ